MKILLALASLALATPAAAEITSAYTSYDLDKCRVIAAPAQDEEFAGTWGCPGFENKPEYEIVFSEGDLRSLVSFGQDHAEHCSSIQSFGGFNSVNSTVEWRLKDGKPFAAIQRWTVSYDPEDSNKIHSWLVVTRIEPGNSCQLAYVEGAMPGANEKARMIADAVAATSQCGAEEKIIVARSGHDWSETPGGPTCPAP